MVIGVLFFAFSANSAANDTERPENSAEEFELKLENWMLNSDLFFEMVHSEKNFTLEEQELLLEPWMLDDIVFSEYLNVNEKKQKDDFRMQEEDLKVESWMVDLKEFTNF